MFSSKFRTARTFGALAAAAIATLAASSAATAGTVDIVAGYDYSSPTYVADTFFTVVNGSGSTLSSIAFTSVGDGSLTTADTATWTWTGVSIASGSSYTLYFPTTGAGVSGTGYGFTADYEFSLAGNDQSYAFRALAGTSLSSASFSPTSNSTGGFVAFLGNDASGNSLPANTSATVASATVSATVPAVPEPSTTALLAVGLFAAGVAARKGRSAPR